MEIRADEITKIIREQLGGFTAEVDVAEVGTVLSVGDGIARIHGLERCMAGELLELPARRHGPRPQPRRGLGRRRAHGRVQPRSSEGDEVKRTGRIMSVPAGDAHDRPRGERARPAHRRQGPHRHQGLQRRSSVIAPGVVERQPVREPLETGIKAIDAMVNIGRGQRELLIGDRQTGKTAIAIDTIINQKGKGVICIYVAIGQKRSTVAQVVKTLEDFGAMEHTIVVSATASEPAPLLYIAPLRGLRHRRVLPRQRPARAVRLRRPHQARRGLPRDLAAAAPAARPRGVPGRRLLPAQPPAGARGQALRHEGRRQPDRHPDHRDPGRRHLGLHPDERHLDHGRPDLPGVATSSTPASVPPSTSATRSRASAGPRR